jgi:hypothetical protein
VSTIDDDSDDDSDDREKEDMMRIRIKSSWK